MTAGQISVKLIPIHEGDPVEMLHLQFGTLAEFYLGLAKQRFGFSPYEDLHQEVSMGLLFNAAIDAYNVIHKVPTDHTVDQNLALLDRVADEDKQMVLEVANNSMGFINTAMMKMMAKMIEIREAAEGKKPAPFKTGSMTGKKERGSHLVVSD